MKGWHEKQIKRETNKHLYTQKTITEQREIKNEKKNKKIEWEINGFKTVVTCTHWTLQYEWYYPYICMRITNPAFFR